MSGTTFWLKPDRQRSRPGAFSKLILEKTEEDLGFINAGFEKLRQFCGLRGLLGRFF
jgi:hypothetical protein